MKKLVWTAFMCVVASAHAATMPTCTDLLRDSGIPHGQVLDETARQKILARVAAEASKKPELEIVQSLMVFCGAGFPKDVPKALGMLEEGVQTKKTYAAFLLYTIYAGIFGSEEGLKDEAKAKWYLSEMERNGEPTVQFDLGQSYYQGDVPLGLPKSRFKAEQLWIRAASGGWLEAYAALGGFYMDDKNYGEAARWLELGNAAGELRSKHLLGYLLAAIPGPHSDAPRGVQLLKSLSAQGHIPSQYLLGSLYFDGLGVQQDYLEALRWFRMAAEANNSKAQEVIAFCYEFGVGVALDLRQALQWRQKAAANGLALAKSNLDPAKMYPKVASSVAAKDLAESTKWYRLAAQDGTAQAQLNLARYLAQASNAEALHWYGLAGAQGNLAALADMGAIYGDGRLGADRNAVVAYALQMVVDAHNPEPPAQPQARLAQLETGMTADEIAKAKQLALALGAPGMFQTALDHALKP